MYQHKKSAYEKGLVKKFQVSGKIECGPFKEKEIPIEAIESYDFKNMDFYI